LVCHDWAAVTEAGFVMAGLVPAIHALLLCQGVDARHEAGHDTED
jgi:hypothetical protein